MKGFCIHSTGFLVWFVLGGGVLLSSLSTFYTKSNIDRLADREFNFLCGEINAAIAGRLDDHARILLSGAALFNSSDVVTRKEWRIFTHHQKIEKQLPGIQGIGFSLLIPRAELARHIQEIRNEGFPEYTVKPDEDRELYSSIIYLEPFSERNLRAFGYDMLSEPVRRVAMERARDTDAAALSGKVVLVQETGKDIQAGALMYVPVYRKGMPTDSVEQRRAAIYGWVYSPYRMNDLMQGLLGRRHLGDKNQLCLQIYDGELLSPQSLLFESSPAEKESHRPGVRFTQVIPLDFNGHRWTLRLSQVAATCFSSEYTKMWLTLAGGLVITILLSVLIRVLLNTRNAAQRIAGELTLDLKKTEMQLHSTLESTADGILAVDNEGKVIQASQRFFELWRIPPSLRQNIDDQVLQHFVLSQLLEPDAFQKKVQELYNSDAVVLDILYFKDGRVFERYSAPMVMDGIPAGRVWSFRDITVRRTVEEAHARLAMAVEQAAETIMITDPDGTIIYANPAFEKISGFTRAETLGHNPRILKSGKQTADFYRQMWATLASGHVWKGNFINKRKDGSLYEEDATISPVCNGDGKICNYVAVKHDVTREVQLKRQLLEVQKMEAVGRLAGGVAHDFNNLLTVIMGYTELCRGILPAEHPGRVWLDKIINSSKRSAALTHQLLAFARRQVIAPRILDLNVTVEGMLSLLRQMIGEDVQLVWLPSGKPETITFDSSQIDQILVNLCVNARDAITGVGKITIKTANITMDPATCANLSGAVPGEYVLLTVYDDGRGMAKDVLDHIFEPFFTTKAFGEGTGLGLATVYGIVKQNNGYIDVTSLPGQGACFNIYLPRVVCETLSSPVAITAGAPQGRGETVMIVEDERSLREICRLYLDRLGYKTLAAENPQAALDMAAKHPDDIQLLLTDVVMPGMNGRDLAKNMLPLYPHLKYLFMSGYTADIIARQGVLDEGMQFLSKPFSRDVLARKVREVLEG